MITVTPAAIAQIKTVLSANPTVEALRLSVHGGGCSGFQYRMTFDTAGPLDKKFVFDGVTVLIDSISFMYLDGVTIDYATTLEQSGFKFDNPNATSTCGCGKSFGA